MPAVTGDGFGVFTAATSQALPHDPFAPSDPVPTYGLTSPSDSSSSLVGEMHGTHSTFLTSETTLTSSIQASRTTTTTLTGMRLSRHTLRLRLPLPAQT